MKCNERGKAAVFPAEETKEICKIPKFVVNRPIVSKIQPSENFDIYQGMYGNPDAVRAQRPDGHTFLS